MQDTAAKMSVQGIVANKQIKINIEHNIAEKYLSENSKYRYFKCLEKNL